MFSSVKYDEMLEPTSIFANEESILKYPAIPAHEQVANELKAIGLMH